MFGIGTKEPTTITSWQEDPQVLGARETAENAAAAVKATAKLLDRASAVRLAAAADFEAALSESDLDRAERAQTEAADAEAKARKAYERAILMKDRSAKSLALAEASAKKAVAARIEPAFVEALDAFEAAAETMQAASARLSELQTQLLADYPHPRASDLLDATVVPKSLADPGILSLASYAAKAAKAATQWLARAEQVRVG
jgi:hypothetical protein